MDSALHSVYFKYKLVELFYAITDIDGEGCRVVSPAFSAFCGKSACDSVK